MVMASFAAHRMFASTSIREPTLPAAPPNLVGASPPAPSQPAPLAANDTFMQNGQDRKLAFVNASVDTRTTSPDRVAAPASSYVVQAGNSIPAALITGMRSDLPAARSRRRSPRTSTTVLLWGVSF